MDLKTVTIADLTPHPDNPNTHPTEQIDALGNSLDEFDQVKNVVIWRGMMLAGHAVREAAIKSGRLTLDAVDVSDWDEAKAMAFMLADIRLPDMGGFDEAAMAEALRDIEEPLDIPGIDEEFLERMIGVKVDDPLEEWGGMPEFKQEDKTSFQSIHVHFKNTEEVDEFAKLIGQSLTDKTRSIWYSERERMLDGRERYVT